MGTQNIPNWNTEHPIKHNGNDLKQPIMDDTPRIGMLMWVLIFTFFIPPALVTFLGNLSGGLPHQELWIVLLGIPIPLILFGLPRKYVLNQEQLLIIGYMYRVRIPRKEILWARPLAAHKALVRFGSIFCSSPDKAVEIKRKKGWSVIISPTDPKLFIQLLSPENKTDSSSHP